MITFEYYHATGEYVIYVDGVPVDTASDDDGIKYTLMKAKQGLFWVEVAGRSGVSPTQPRFGVNVEWFRRYVNGLDCR